MYILENYRKESSPATSSPKTFLISSIVVSVSSTVSCKRAACKDMFNDQFKITAEFISQESKRAFQKLFQEEREIRILRFNNRTPFICCHYFIPKFKIW